MVKKILLLNGPNLNLLGIREPEVYGTSTLHDLEQELEAMATAKGWELIAAQSNVEGELVNHLQSHGFEVQGIIFNPGGYTHTSVALHDAIAAIDSPVIEVHISHPDSRENFRKDSLIRSVCAGTISGLGLESYRAALRYLIHQQ